MAQQHIIPGVTFEKIASPNSIILPGGVAEVCIIGLAKTTRTIKEDLVGTTAMQDPTGATVALSSASVESITSIINNTNFGVNYIEGVTGVTGNYTLVAPNVLDWSPYGTTATDRPAIGDSYTVTYEATKVTADYGYKTFYDLESVKAEYGDVIYPTRDQITLAADFFFANGGKRLHTIQLDGDDIAAYTEALAKLELEEVDVLVPLIPHDTTGFSTLFSVTKSHVYRMSQVDVGMNRMAFVSGSSPATVANYVSYGQAINYERMMLTAPSTFVSTINGVDETISSVYANVAMASLLADPARPVSEPITRKELFGFKSIPTRYLRGEVEALIEGGVLVIEQVGSADAPTIRVVQGITTDRDSIENNEITLVRLGDFFGKQLKAVLETMYIGGQINNRTMASMRATITSVGNSFVTNGAIQRYENISVVQDIGNPTLVNVSLQLVPIYPMNFIDIKFTIGL